MENETATEDRSVHVSRKKNPKHITVRDSIGCLSRTAHDEAGNTFEEQPATLEITATPESWERLRRAATDDPEGFAYDFLMNFAGAAIGGVNRKPSKKERLIYKIKTEAAWLYAFLQFWSLRKEKERPTCFRGLVKALEKDGYLIHDHGKYDLISMTLFALQKIHEKEAAALKLRPFAEPDNFYITYIQHKPVESFRRILLANDPERAADLVRRIPPLKRVFSGLSLT